MGQKINLNFALEIRKCTQVHFGRKHPFVIAELLVIQPGFSLVTMHQAEEVVLFLAGVRDSAFQQHAFTLLGRVIIAVRATGRNHLIFIRAEPRFLLLDTALRKLPGTGGFHSFTKQYPAISSLIDNGGIRAVKFRGTWHMDNSGVCTCAF